jgi:hypothetical protein
MAPAARLEARIIPTAKRLRNGRYGVKHAKNSNSLRMKLLLFHQYEAYKNQEHRFSSGDFFGSQLGGSVFRRPFKTSPSDHPLQRSRGDFSLWTKGVLACRPVLSTRLRKI